MEANYPGLNNKCLSRGEHSNRQDWALEAAYEIFPLLQPLLDYEVKSLLDEANVLRDSILIQLETLHFEAYIHVCALMWRVIFMELRGLTNSKGLELNPMTLNTVYEHLYDVGALLQTANALSIFEPGFRPWPHIYQGQGKSMRFYMALERDLVSDMANLRAFRGRADETKYAEMLRKVLDLFGKGIIASLEFTMKNYLKQTNGNLRNNAREQWEVDMCKAMLCHNNAAERPFAVLRQYQRLYPSLSIENLAKLTTSIVNGTHRPALKGQSAGVALTSNPRLRTVIGQLCNVRRTKVRPSLTLYHAFTLYLSRTRTHDPLFTANPNLDAQVGQITAYMREANKADKKESVEVRKRKTAERYEANIKKQKRKAALRDHAEEILCTSVVTSIAALHVQLDARPHSSAARIAFLKDQFHARVSGATARSYPGIGDEFRSKFGKLKLTPMDATQNKEQYLIALLEAMITEDGDTLGHDIIRPQFTENFIRVLPALSVEYTNPLASDLKAEFSKHIADQAAPEDDPMYVKLHGQYIGHILYDFETRANAKLFRVIAIQFVRSVTSTRASCWEATCEPVYRDPATGHFLVPNAVQVPGSNVTITHALQGYCLAEYKQGLDAEPTELPWVQQYIDHFRTIILPKYPSLFLDSPSTEKDLPASPQKRKASTQKDLPSLSRTRPRRTTKVPVDSA